MTRKRTQGPDVYETLKKLVAGIGFIRRGSVVRRFMPCSKPGCRCQGTPPRLHGPYYQWTRKVRGKTVTVRLSPEEAALMQKWIANGRQLDKLVSRMETLSLQVTERMLRQVRIS